MLVGTVLIVQACVDIQGPAPQPLPTNQVISELQIGSSAAMIEVGDTVQLTVRAVAMDESEIAVDPSMIRWGSSDSSQVYVDSLGRVIGKVQSTIPVTISAAYRHVLTTKFDTVQVYVTENRINATSVRIVVLDSNRVGANPLFGYPRIRTDLYRGDTLVLVGAQIPISATQPVVLIGAPNGGPDGEPVYFVSNDKSRLGKFWITTSVNLYGNEVRDSIEFTGTYPIIAPAIQVVTGQAGGIQPDTLAPDEPIQNVAPCGIVVIFSLAMVPIDIVFSDSTASSVGCDPIAPESLLGFGFPVHGDFIGGNVMTMPPFSVAVRRSNTTGTISYYVRDAITKERLPVSRYYRAIAVE